MYCVFDEITNTTDGGLYVLVRFWPDRGAFDRSDLATCRESFEFPHVQKVGLHIIVNHLGWWKRESDGVFIDPATVPPEDPTKWAKEPFDIDIRKLIQDAATAYWTRRQAANLSPKPWPQEHANTAATRTLADPRNLMNPTLIAMRNTGWEPI